MKSLKHSFVSHVFVRMSTLETLKEKKEEEEVHVHNNNNIGREKGADEN